jgi:iron complex transport system substrate-binding protein
MASVVVSSCSRQHHAELDRAPERIISLAPNITETLFAIGQGPKVVGATTFCTYPPQAADLPRIGGFGQFNYEAIVSLKPDLVILHEEYESEVERLNSLGIPYLKTGSYFTADILETIRKIGSACDAVPEAETLIGELETRISALPRPAGQPKRVLITFSGSADEDIEQVHAFGASCLHNELIELAGGKNIVESRLPYALLSKEAIIRLDPEIIIELAPGVEPPENPAVAWKSVSSITAVQNNEIYVLTGDYTCIPGPRFVQTLEDLSNIIGGRQ